MILPKFIDLTHELSSDIPCWEGDCGFQHRAILDYEQCKIEPKFRVQELQMKAGAGTHMDAPSHCIPGAKDIADFSLEQLIFPCVVIDISDRADASYCLTGADIDQYEKQYGKIVAGSFVIVYTSWERYWSDPAKYRNNYHFPSVSQGAAELLLTRDIAGIGIDTLSPDCPDKNFIVHQLLLGQGKIIVENIANAKLLPPKGAYLFVVPLKMAGATESPIRLIGLIE